MCSTTSEQSGVANLYEKSAFRFSSKFGPRSPGATGIQETENGQEDGQETIKGQGTWLRRSSDTTSSHGF